MATGSTMTIEKAFRPSSFSDASDENDAENAIRRAQNIRKYEKMVANGERLFEDQEPGRA